MIKLMAFDWNGTIFSDTYAIFESINEVLKVLNKKPTTLREFQKHFDVPVTRTYLGLGISEELLKDKAQEIVNTFHTNYEIRAAKVRTRAYAKSLLVYLSENNIKSIIFSNHIDEPIRKQLKRLKIEKYFSVVLANSKLDSSLKGRNKHAKVKKYIKDYNLKPQEVLMIGDTIEEIEIGKEIGVKTIAITHGNCSTARLIKAKPDYLTNSLKEVIGIIKSINIKS